MVIELIIALGLFGLAMGSFVEALTWRLYKGKDFIFDRSECVNCHHKLGFWDLIPLISWVSLGGRCRYCKKSIGIQAPLLEISMSLLFVVSYLVWPVILDDASSIISFVAWLGYLVVLAALFVYDLRHMILPDKLILTLIIIAVADLIFGQSPFLGTDLISHAVLGILALAGFYWMLYLVSKGEWVGFGDVKLSIFIGLVLGWQKAILALVLANLVGLIIILPGLIGGSLNRKSRVPFGPFLIIGFILAALFGDFLMSFYVGTFLEVV